MKHLEPIIKLMPRHIADYIPNGTVKPEEIRLRVGQPVVVRAAGDEYTCSCTPVTRSDMVYLITNATNGAYHKVQEFMAQGYLPLPGGCRMGISGAGASGTIRSARDVSSLCIRIAGEAFGCADSVISYIADPVFHNTIIIAPPGAGKTTLLRELIRTLSMRGYYVAVADERGEVSGMTNGQACFDLGPRCDSMVGVPKQKAAIMMLRGMAPQILAMDEITALCDMEAITEAVGCGVGLLTTIHGVDISALQKPVFREIYDTMVFEKAIIIHIGASGRSYQVVNIYE